PTVIRAYAQNSGIDNRSNQGEQTHQPILRVLCEGWGTPAIRASSCRPSWPWPTAPSQWLKFCAWPPQTVCEALCDPSCLYGVHSLGGDYWLQQRPPGFQWQHQCGPVPASILPRY